MENIELQKIWKKADKDIYQRSKEEIDMLLQSKARQTINKFLFVIGISTIVCIGVLVFLTIASLNRQDDIMYLINNITLGVLNLLSLTAGLIAWHEMQKKHFNQSLKNWLEGQIYFLSKWIKGKYRNLYLFIIPLLYMLTVLSIHVYFENKTFIEVLSNEESVVGLIVAAPVGLFISFYLAKRIRKYQLQNLDFLKDLHSRVCNVE